MYPTLFKAQLGNWVFELSSYRLFIIISLLYLFFISWIMLKPFFPSWKRRLIVLLSETIVFFLGSRLLYGILYLPEIIQDPALLMRFQLSNFSLYGGLGLSFALWYYFSKRLKVSFFRITDALSLHVGVTLALMKLGCYFNGCCYGTMTKVPWGISYPVDAGLYPLNESLKSLGLFPPKVHPAQLYEVGAALLAGGLAWIMLRKKNKEGLATIIFGLAYTSLRWLIFYFRAFPQASDLSNFIRGPIVYGVAITFFYLALIRIKQSK